MTPEEFQAVYPHFFAWIQRTLIAHKGKVRTVASRGFMRLPLYFSEKLLVSTNVVAVERVPIPPLSAMGLDRFADFERGDFDGITYLDTFFVKHYRADDERLYFHELIHVVQWRLLGPQRFLATYAAGLEAFGYRNSPLEAMAYDAEALFSQSYQIFDTERLVAEKLSYMRIT